MAVTLDDDLKEQAEDMNQTVLGKFRTIEQPNYTGFCDVDLVAAMPHRGEIYPARVAPVPHEPYGEVV